MLCFKCKNEMEKTIFEGVVIDYCFECNSVWMDKEEFEQAVSGIEFNAEECVNVAKSEEKEEKIRFHNRLLCPKCEIGKMVKITKFGVELDQCEKCEGTFFDRDELKKCYDKATGNFFTEMWNYIKEMF